MTLYEAYRYGEQNLLNAKIEEADLDAWYLLEFVTGINRARYYMDKNEEMSLEQELKYQQCIAKRSMHIPLQHITGTQAFMGLDFEVSKEVLIPRQDTEILVETILEMNKQEESSNLNILDLCTGSGCIIISLLSLLEGKQVTGVCSDISKEALLVCERNAKKNQVDAKLSMIQSDLFEKIQGEYDIIVSNPPYIPTAEIEKLQVEVKVYDPFIALDGKEDGLYFYKKIIEKSKCFFKEKGHLFFEIGHNQGDSVKQLMVQEGYDEIQVKKDLAGLDRVVCGVYNKAKK